jgi:hypothetical protein
MTRPADDDRPPDASGRARADRELRNAVLVAIPVLLAGQALLLLGWWPVAVVIGGGGTVVAFMLARRWHRMSAGDGG